MMLALYAALFFVFRLGPCFACPGMDYHSFGEDYDGIHQKLSAEEAYISGFLEDATKNNIVLANVTFKMRDATG